MCGLMIMLNVKTLRGTQRSVCASMRTEVCFFSLYRTIKICFVSGTMGPEGELEVLSHGSVRGAAVVVDNMTQQRLLHTTCFLRYIYLRQEGGAAQRLCVAAAVTGLGTVARFKNKKKKNKNARHKRSTCSGWSSAYAFHVALASTEPSHRQSGAATAGGHIGMAAEMEPSE